MKTLSFAVGAGAALLSFALTAAEPQAAEPAPVRTPAHHPPSDAIILFDGTSLDGWTKLDGGPAGWHLDKDAHAMIVASGAGNIVSKEIFRDCQLHLEFRTPSPATGEGQNRGNSGVYFHSRYEVQVLDSFQSSTYVDGQCGAIYKKHAPLVNACREPGEWQTYDIVFRAPRFDDKGVKTASATLTVLHNGVLIQDHAEVDGPTGSAASGTESADAGGVMLQDHSCAVQYRNIWMRRL
jgi:Domain of Unknown Function (DUF1080)